VADFLPAVDFRNPVRLRTVRRGRDPGDYEYPLQFLDDVVDEMASSVRADSGRSRITRHHTDQTVSGDNGGGGLYRKGLHIARKTAHANHNVRVLDLVLWEGTDKVDGYFFEQRVLAQGPTLLAGCACCWSVLLTMNTTFDKLGHVTAHAGPLVACGIKRPYRPVDAVVLFHVVVK
jgi:hypothetical protein